jgi:hypothetical protein
MSEPWDLSRWTTLSLRVSSDKLSTNEISRALGIAPSRTLEKGELLSPSSPRSARTTVNLWVLKSELPPTESMAAHLMQMLGLLENRVTALHELAASCDMDFFVGFSSESQAGDVIEHPCSSVSRHCPST